MKKILFNVLIVSILMLSLTLVVYAHSGRTDSSGGHIDKSTGKYHYHHGYPAHSHYDINGDGFKDCPYTYTKKPNHSNNNNTNKDNNNTDSTIEDRENKTTFWDVIKAVLILIPALLVSFHALLILEGLCFAIIDWILENLFKIRVNEDKIDRIAPILAIIELVILLPIEFVYILNLM